MPSIQSFLESVAKDLNLSEENPEAPVIAGFDPQALMDTMHKMDTTEDIDAAFAPALALTGADRENAGKFLEASVLFEFVEIEEAVKREGLAAVKAKLAAPEDISAQEIEEAQMLAQFLHNVEKLRGANVTPMTKAFNEAAANLTDEEYNSPAVCIKPMLALTNTLGPQEALKPNPLNRHKVLRKPQS